MKSGGRRGGRQIDMSDPLEADIFEIFGDRICENYEFATKIWSAFTNTYWSHYRYGNDFGFSYRAAGDMIAAIRGDGDYMDWYCCAPSAVVSEEISSTMAAYGWLHQPVKD